MPLGAPTDIETFDTAAARDSVIVAPKISQGVFLLSTGELLFYYGPYLGWRPPWNTPWSVAGGKRVYISANVPINALGATDNRIAGLSFEFSPVVNRQYEIVFDGGLDSGTTGDLISIGINVYGTSNTRLRGTQETIAIQAAGLAPTPNRQRLFCVNDLTFQYPWAAGQPHTIVVVANQASGSGGVVTGDNNLQSSLAIVDLGSIGPPIYK